MTVYTAFKDPAVVRALSHPLRTRILNELYEGRASPTELAEKFDAPLANVAYHVRVLLDLKLIKLVKKTQRRGAIEHHYEAVSGFIVDDDAWASTPTIVKQKMVAGVLEDIGRQVTDAAATGGFEHDDSHLTRTRLVLDEQGWSQLSSELHKLLDKAETIQAQSKKRLEKNDHAGERRTGLVSMLFESSPAVPDPSAAAAPVKKTKAAPKSRARSHVS